MAFFFVISLVLNFTRGYNLTHFLLKSYFGANVLHPRTIIPVMNYNIPITIRNVFNLAAPGTKIWRHPMPEGDGVQSDDGREEFSTVKAFATIDNVALVNVEGY